MNVDNYSLLSTRLERGHLPLLHGYWFLLQHKPEASFPHLFKAYNCMPWSNRPLQQCSSSKSLLQRTRRAHQSTSYLNAAGKGVTQTLAWSSFITAHSTKLPLTDLPMDLVFTPISNLKGSNKKTKPTGNTTRLNTRTVTTVSKSY